MSVWSNWAFGELGITLPLIGTAVLYAIGARRARGFRPSEMICYWLGWITLTLALVSPLHELGEHLFSAHMVQHEIIMTIAAPLIIWGRTLIAFLWAVPRKFRRTLGRISSLGSIGALAAWLLHAAVLWLWHIPPLFNRTVTDDLTHSLQHLSFLFAALIYWWSLTLAPGKAVLSMFTTAIHTVMLGALITLAPHPLYTAYVGRTAPYGLTPLEDQQLGGLIMWVPAGLVYIGAALALVYRWLKQSDRAVLACLSVICLAGLYSTGCSSKQNVISNAARLSGGKPERGATKIAYYGCGGCHSIPGISGANALVGPPLAGIGDRVYIAGVLPNTPDNMVRWIQHPRQVDEKTAMPDLDVTASDARDISAYLLTLR